LGVWEVGDVKEEEKDTKQKQTDKKALYVKRKESQLGFTPQADRQTDTVRQSEEQIKGSLTCKADRRVVPRGGRPISKVGSTPTYPPFRTMVKAPTPRPDFPRL